MRTSALGRVRGWRRHQEGRIPSQRNSPRSHDISIEKSIISLIGTPCCAGLIKCAVLPLARQGLGSLWVERLRCVTLSQCRARDDQAAAQELLMKSKARTNNNVKGGGKKKKKNNCFINSVYENGWREKKRLSAALNESRLAKQLGMISLYGAVYCCVMMCCPVNCILGGDLMYYLRTASRKKTQQTFSVDSLHAVRGVGSMKIARQFFFYSGCYYAASSFAEWKSDAQSRIGCWYFVGGRGLLAIC